MDTIDKKLYSLSLSKFRSSFKLKKKDIDYINDKGIDVIRSHAIDFINNRLAPEEILNDGKQTPMHGHPVFIAQHATGCCCRGCLYKWHHIQKDKELNSKEKAYILDLMMRWINNQMIMYNKKEAKYGIINNR